MVYSITIRKIKNSEKKISKRISKHVIAYLEEYFLVGNANKSDRYSAEKMQKELIELVKIGSLEKSDVPKVSTIQNWIARYVMQHKQKM
ncbi:43673_t:CDS:2, partial [Gigaspora margarita]